MPEYGNKNKRKPKKLTPAQEKAAAKAEKLRKKGSKKLSKGYKIRAKVEASQRGETPAMSEKKMNRKRSRADKKNEKGFKSIRKAKSIDPTPPSIKDTGRKERAAKVMRQRAQAQPARRMPNPTSRLPKSGDY